MKNRNTITICTTILLACFAISPMAKAVVPAPDGGYPGGNTAEGQAALLSLTTGRFNTAAGWLSLRSITTGSFNTAVGAGTLFANTADQNTAAGTGALLSNTTGGNNTANGAFALFSNTTGNNNTAIGQAALMNTTGTGNTALGYNAGLNQTTGTGNIYIGRDVVGFAGEVNACYIGNIFGNSAAGGTTVIVNSSGKLGTVVSSQGFKEEVKPMDRASEALLALKPVTFRYKKDIDSERTLQFGLVAEDVEKVNPDLIVRDKEGRPYSVRYDQVNAMLLNEFLKEHRKVEDLEGAVASLAATVKEQAAQIQKVSAGVEMSKFATERIRRGEPAPKMVLNNP